MKNVPFHGFALATIAAAAVSACGGGNDSQPLNTKPSFVGTVNAKTYDGNSDDLLTGGLGKTGLASATPPAYANPTAPTVAELRRAAIYNNYRAIVDTTSDGGYGRLFGPNVDAAGNATTSEGKVAGTEYITYADDGSGKQNVTLMVQVPSTFSTANPCIITATSSGSRGVYGAISTGEWGLRKGCAVAYTDKGTGGSTHDLRNDTVPLIDGTRATSAAAAKAAHFRAELTAQELAAFNTATPDRFAFKHAHSQQNPEKDWGTHTLQAVEFAFYVLNQQLAASDAGGAKLQDFKASNTLVIASSLSNGGGAAVAAAELDTKGLIDGVAVSEPNVNLPANAAITIKRGNNTLLISGKPLYDYTTVANLYQACAALAPSVAAAPGRAFVVTAFATNRCASLKAKGLLASNTTSEQGEESLLALRAYGWEPEGAILHTSLAAFEVASAVSVTYANSLSRASVKDNLCGYSYASTTGAGVINTLAATSLAQMFSTGNGVPPSSGVQLINNLNPGGPVRDVFSASPSSLLQDYNLDGANCLRQLMTGTDTAAKKLQAGVDETRRTGDLRGKPAIIVHGRDDALLPVNHTSRPYFGLNKKTEGSASKLSYIEVTNAQHFDTFIGLPTLLGGYDSRYIPLHVYLFRALDAVYANLKDGTALPPSQVVRTVPRGGTPGAAPAITAANVPPIAATAAAGNAIAYSSGTVTIPE